MLGRAGYEVKTVSCWMRSDATCGCRTLTALSHCLLAVNHPHVPVVVLTVFPIPKWRCRIGKIHSVSPARILLMAAQRHRPRLLRPIEPRTLFEQAALSCSVMQDSKNAEDQRDMREVPRCLNTSSTISPYFLLTTGTCRKCVLRTS